MPGLQNSVLAACYSKGQFKLSIRHRYATVHRMRSVTRKTLRTACSEKYQQGLRPSFSEGLKRKSWEMKQATQARRNMQIGGHDLVHVNVALATRPKLVRRPISKKQPQRIHSDRVTLKQCFLITRWTQCLKACLCQQRQKDPAIQKHDAWVWNQFNSSPKNRRSSAKLGGSPNLSSKPSLQDCFGMGLSPILAFDFCVTMCFLTQSKDSAEAIGELQKYGPQ